MEENKQCKACNEQRSETEVGSGNFNVCSQAEYLRSKGHKYCNQCGRKL